VGLATHRIAAKGFCLFPVVPLLWAFIVTQCRFLSKNRGQPLVAWW
jgi:hypothetical protein